MEDMYVMGDNGRELSAKAKGEGILKYFNRCGLYPYTSEITNNERIKLKGVIDKNVNINEPCIILSSSGVAKEVFTSIALNILSLPENKDKNVLCKVVDLSYIVHLYFNENYTDLSIPFDNYKILFIQFDNSIMPNTFNSFCITSLVNSRKNKGLYTFLYFEGTKAEIQQDRWRIDELGLGKEAGDERIMVSLEKYIKIFDLNTKFKIVKSRRK